MGGRDHSIECEACGMDRGGLNDLECDCDLVMPVPYYAHALWPVNLASSIRDAAIGCAGFDSGVDHASGVQSAWWYPGCNIGRPITPNAEGKK